MLLASLASHSSDLHMRPNNSRKVGDLPIILSLLRASSKGSFRLALVRICLRRKSSAESSLESPFLDGLLQKDF